MYGQASYFIWDLRLAMGEAAFQAFLQDYAQQYRDQISSTDSFFALAQTHSPTDLTSLRSIYFGE
jgi:hypothetical protein